MLNEELLLGLRESMYHKALEQGADICNYLESKAKVLAGDMKLENAHQQIAANLKDIIDVLSDMYEDQVVLRASIETIDGLWVERERSA